MMEHLNNIEIIENYLSGKMNVEEKLEFEAAMNADIVLKNAVLFHKELLKGISVIGDMEMKSSLRKIETNLKDVGFFNNFGQEGDLESSSNELVEDQILKNQIKTAEYKITNEGYFENKLDSRKKSKRNSGLSRNLNYKVLAAAAAIIMLFGVIFFMNNDSTHSYEGLYSQNFEPKPEILNQQLTKLNELGFADPNLDRNKSLKLMLNSIKSCESSACRFGAINEHLKAFPKDPTATFYFGVALMQDEKFESAITKFDAVSSISDLTPKNQIMWYKALCKLRINADKIIIREDFEDISKNKDSEYSNQAEKILLELKDN